MTTSASVPAPVQYPAEDHMGEAEVQRFISTLLLELLQTLLRERGTTAHVSSDTFFYWVAGDPSYNLAPDLYVIPNVSQSEEVDSWFTWERPCVPCFALEIVGANIKKDYEDVPALYRALGVDELVLFDPRATARSRKRKRWTHFRKNKRGALSAIEQHERESVRLESLDVHLRRVVLEDGRVRLRLAHDAEGKELVPTHQESAQRALLRLESERMRAETERSAREAAEKRADALEAELRRLREGTLK